MRTQALRLKLDQHFTAVPRRQAIVSGKFSRISFIVGRENNLNQIIQKKRNTFNWTETRAMC